MICNAEHTKAHRLAILAAIPPEDDTVAPELRTIRRNPDKRRVVTDEGQVPVVSMEAVLLREVERTAERHEAALEDLRRWRLSHDHAEGGVI